MATLHRGPAVVADGLGDLTLLAPQVLTEAVARLELWRTATALPAGPDCTDVIARLRRYLADDLDTPKALAAVDGWATDALEYSGHDTSAPQTVRTAIDALLGVR